MARHRARRWRRRGERAQVAAVATILGLLLVVTFIANYLSTTLPNQMSVNDLNHEIQVENQLGRLQATLEKVSSAGLAGAPAIQPITLGTAGAPPFAGSDGSVISNISGEPLSSSTFSLASTRYAPPTGWVYGGTWSHSKCIAQPSTGQVTTFTCNGAGSSVNYNFTNCPSDCVFTDTAVGTFWGNYSVNSSLISISQAGGANGFQHVIVVGNYNEIWFNGTGNGGNIVNITIVGNYNTLNISGASGWLVKVLIVGNHDRVTFSSNGNSNSLLLVGWGKYDSYNTSTSSGNRVFYNGFDPELPISPFCPYPGYSSTDTVGVMSKNGGVGGVPSGIVGTVTYNNTVPTTQNSHWTYTAAGTLTGTCVFFPQFLASGLSLHSASILVQVKNTYAPAAEIAFDQGAVVYAQAGGNPILIDGPPISYAGGAVTVWVPGFLNPIGTEAGIGTAVLSFHLVTVLKVTAPGQGWVLNPSVPVTLTYYTPYACAWVSYFAGIPAFHGHYNTSASPQACQAPYQPGQPAQKVTVSLPATTLTIELAVFAISLG